MRLRHVLPAAIAAAVLAPLAAHAASPVSVILRDGTSQSFAVTTKLNNISNCEINPPACDSLGVTVAIPAGYTATNVKVSVTGTTLRGLQVEVLDSAGKQIASADHCADPTNDSAQLTFPAVNGSYSVVTTSCIVPGTGTGTIQLEGFRATAVSGKLPNAKLSGLTVTKSGSSVIEKATLTNTGTARLAGVVVTAYDNGKAKVSKTFTLAPGASTLVTLKFAYTRSSTARSYSLVADPARKIREASESDNSVAMKAQLG